jgi:hypothetical protein
LLDAWFASRNIHQISSFVAEENILPGGGPTILAAGAELVIPLAVAAFLADLHLIDDKIDFTLFSKSFASARNLRDILILFAVDSLIEVSDQIHRAEDYFLSCDKGNKKGLSHFVKILLWWDKTEKKVQTFVPDIDVSKGTSEGCVEAILHLMKKANNTTITLSLKGQTTDSGGGCWTNMRTCTKRT